jgi:NTP pyrophosphatase (non-canonical NTP hydrolase)
MDFDRYQRLSARTDQKRTDTTATDTADGSGTESDAVAAARAEALVVHLLGLAGEAGSVASEYKKYLRDGDAHHWWKARMHEELGDVLWYLANVATHLDLDLSEIAEANITKTQQRWLLEPAGALDSEFPETERLPRRGAYEFRSGFNDAGRASVKVFLGEKQIGDELTDAAHTEDGYRFHDVFHLSYATLLGWSPITRSLAKLKRRSNETVDENEDGGRAGVIEEGIAALVFAYATQHDMGAGVERLDQKLLDTIAMLAGPLEVGIRTHAEWEAAILAGLKAFRSLVEHDGGFVIFDAGAALFEFSPTAPTTPEK